MKAFCSLHSLEVPPELRLMLACLRISPNDKEVQEIEKLSRTKVAWPDFLMWVDHHRVAPLVYYNLSRYAGKAIPSFIMNDLRSRFERNAHRSLINAAELVRLSRVFQENGIPVLPLKGSVLALQVYGNLALRHAGDIDLLIAPHHVELADRLLQAEYRRTLPAFQLTPFQQNQFNDLFHHFEYVHDQMSLGIELHWRFIYYSPSHVMEFAGVQSHAQYVAVAGSQLPVMPREDTILYLCAHGAGHYWYRLFWLVDLAEIMRQDQGTNWDQLIGMAVEFGIVRPLLQGVILAHIFLDAPLPDPIRAYAGRDRIVPYLTKLACWQIVCPQQDTQPILPLLQSKVYLLRLCSNPTYKFKALKRILVGNPWGRIRLPDPLFLLYYVLRPLMWPYRRLRRSRGQVERPSDVRDNV